MDATAAARRLAAVNRHLGGGGETAGGETTEQQHSTSMALPSVITPSAVSSAGRRAFRADRLLDGQVRGSGLAFMMMTTRVLRGVLKELA